MKLRFIFVLIAMAGMCSVVNAAANDYYPPERIHCSLNDKNQLTCNEFDRQLLTEGTFSPDMPRNKALTYVFSSAVYYTKERQDNGVFFTYKSTNAKMIQLRTTSNSTHPDLNGTGWKKLHSDIYTCDASYMQCPITNA